MSIFQSTILGIIQGLTEFFPVSSSGHLILLPKIFGWEEHSLVLDAFLHLGTGFAVLFYFRKDWLEMARSVASAFRKPHSAFRRAEDVDYGLRIAVYVFLASIPAALAGALLNNWVEANLRSPAVVAVALFTIAILMLIAERNSFSLFRHSGLASTERSRSDPESDGKKILNHRSTTSGRYHVGYTRSGTRQRVQDDTNIDLITTVKMGLSQTLALIPGVSRSGITITAGLFSGLDLRTAARFSFLLSTPIVLGAGIWGLIGVPQTALRVPQITVGFFAAFLSGLLAIKLFLGFLERVGLLPFAVYRIILAVVVATFFL